MPPALRVTCPPISTATRGCAGKGTSVSGSSRAKTRSPSPLEKDESFEPNRCARDPKFEFTSRAETHALAAGGNSHSGAGKLTHRGTFHLESCQVKSGSNLKIVTATQIDPSIDHRKQAPTKHLASGRTIVQRRPGENQNCKVVSAQLRQAIQDRKRHHATANHSVQNASLPPTRALRGLPEANWRTTQLFRSPCPPVSSASVGVEALALR